MTNASDFQLLTRKLHRLVTSGIIAGLLSGTILHAQEQSKSKPKLSKATLEVLEAQAEKVILEAPEAQVSEETLLNSEKKKKIETGGLLKEWFAPFEKKQSNYDQPQKPAGRVKRKPLWSWFNPTAPMSKSELEAEPIDWKGSRKIPQRFGNREKQEPEGWAFFFLRY